MRTLIFDCDGVLVDSEALAEGTLVEYLSRWLPDLDIEQELGQALGMTTSAILAHLEAFKRPYAASGCYRAGGYRHRGASSAGAESHRGCR